MAKERNLIGLTFDCIPLLRRDQFSAITQKILMSFLYMDTRTLQLRPKLNNRSLNRQLDKTTYTSVPAAAKSVLVLDCGLQLHN